MKLAELIQRYRFWRDADRIGPDMLGTHWRLYFKTTMKAMCEQKFMAFGEDSDFRPGAYAECCSKISIGRNVVVRPGSYLFADPTIGGGGIIIGDGVLIGPGVHFYTNNHAFSDTNRPIIDQGYPKPSTKDSINVKHGAWIGACAIILPGVTVGENSVIGAGSVVTRDVPAFSVAVGNPARVIKQLIKD